MLTLIMTGVINVYCFLTRKPKAPFYLKSRLKRKKKKKKKLVKSVLRKLENVNHMRTSFS